VKGFVVALAVVMFSLLAARPALAQTTDACVHEATIQAVRACVQHAAEHGHITNLGVARSLLAKLDAAQAALDRGQAGVAAGILRAAVREVGAQAGIHIVAEHAAHLQTHLRDVIAALAATE
jgi:hypothetical protein